WRRWRWRWWRACWPACCPRGARCGSRRRYSSRPNDERPGNSSPATRTNNARTRYRIPPLRIPLMQVRPILSALLRHKTTAALIVLEIALSCAIVCNAAFVIGSRIGNMHRSSGVVDDELVVIDVSSIRPDLNADAMRMEDLA